MAMSKQGYEPPRITDLGSFADLTQSSQGPPSDAAQIAGSGIQ
jgi:hypothetical protein